MILRAAEEHIIPTLLQMKIPLIMGSLARNFPNVLELSKEHQIHLSLFLSGVAEFLK